MPDATMRHDEKYIIVLFAMAHTACGNASRHSGMTLDDAFQEPGAKVLAESAATGDLRGMDASLEEGIDINTRGSNSVTPLWWAMASNNLQGVRYLLSKGADPNIPTKKVRNALHLAAMNADTQFLASALKAGGDVNSKSGWANSSLLITAITGANDESINLLIESGADLNREDDAGQTPLIVAAMVNDYRTVYKLLMAGADPKIKTVYGENLLTYVFSERISIDPKSDNFVWKEKVRKLLNERETR